MKPSLRTPAVIEALNKINIYRNTSEVQYCILMIMRYVKIYRQPAIFYTFTVFWPATSPH